MQDDFEALAGQVRLAEGADPHRRAAAMARAASRRGADAVNLLQGEFARTTDYGARWHRWRTAAMLAGGLLLAHVAAAALQIHQANHETKALDGEIAQIFAADDADRERCRTRGARCSRASIASATPGPDLNIFCAPSKRSAARCRRRPRPPSTALSYREQSLDMKVTAPSLAALSQLSQLVAKAGAAGRNPILEAGRRRRRGADADALAGRQGASMNA